MAIRPGKAKGPSVAPPGTGGGGGGSLTGGGAANQVAFWIGPTALAGSPALTWDGTALGVGGDIVSTGNVVSLPVGIHMASNYLASAPVATNRKLYKLQTTLSNRFSLDLDATPESGGNAGSNFNLTAYTDGAVAIDAPISIVRASAGLITLGGATVRPVAMTATLAVAGNAGFGGAGVSASQVLRVQNSALTGTAQYGVISNSTFTSAATVSGVAGYFGASFGAAAAAGFSAGVQIDTGSKASGTITTAYGLKIENQTIGVTNYAIFTGTGLVHFGGAVDAASTLSVTGAATFNGATTVNNQLTVFTGTTNLLVLKPTTATNEFYSTWSNDASHRAIIGKDNSTGNALLVGGGSAYALTLATIDTQDLVLATSNIQRFKIDAAGAFWLDAHNSAAELDIVTKSSRGTFNAPTNVANADAPFNLVVQMYSGGTYFSTGQISVAVDGTYTSAQRPPSRIDFYTNVANGPQVLNMRLSGSGALFLPGIASIGGTAPITAIALYVASTTLAGTAQYGVQFESQFNSLATISGTAVYVDARLANGVATSILYGIRVDIPQMGSGASANFGYGIKIENQVVAGVATSYALHTGTGLVHFGGAVDMDSTLAVTGISSLGNIVLLVGAANPGTGNYSLVSKDLHIGIYASTLGASNAFVSWGRGYPSNEESFRMYHDGFEAILESRASGTGVQRPIWLMTTATARVIIGAAGGITFPDLVGSGTTTATLNVDGKLGRTTAVSFSGTDQVVLTTSGSDVNAGVILESALPYMAFHETDAAIDNGWWAFGAQTQQLRLVLFDDSGSTLNNIMTVDRTGPVADLMQIFPRVNTLNLLATAPSTTARAGLRIPPGVAPTTPQNGDIWYDNVTHKLKVRLNGVTRTIQDLP